MLCYALNLCPPSGNNDGPLLLTRSMYLMYCLTVLFTATLYLARSLHHSYNYHNIINIFTIVFLPQSSTWPH